MNENVDPRVPDFEALARRLEASEDYKVLRRLAPRPTLDLPEGATTRLAIVLDVETTGLADSDEVIALAMVPLIYDLTTGTILEVCPAFDRLRAPSMPIPSAITALTGIDDAMVVGQVITEAEVAAFVAPADLVIAHNARFDRRVVERPWSAVFAQKPWGCSQTQVPWASEGFDGSRLSVLATTHGFFYDRHRALHDCHATIEVLARPLPVSGTSAFASLLTNARKRSVRVFAAGAPYDLKDVLKARGYRWSPGDDGAMRAWYRDVEEADLAAELAFLRSGVLGADADPPLKPITAFERFSNRI